MYSHFEFLKLDNIDIYNFSFIIMRQIKMHLNSCDITLFLNTM